MYRRGRHLELPRGMHDVNPDRMQAHDRIRREWFDACRLSGFQAVEVPPVGFAETFETGHNAAGERTYHFPDRGGRELALVSDSLPSVLRLAAGRRLPSQRLCHCTPIFRYERRPRRYFHHLGLMEVHFRPLTPQQHRAATVRILATITDFLAQKVGPTVVLTDPGLWRETIGPTAANRVLNVLRTAASSQRPALLRDAFGDSPAVRLAEAIAADPSGGQLLRDGGPGPDRIVACHELADQLRARGVDTVIDLSELHASEFHDGTAFLLRPGREQRLFGDGGSYDAFAERFIGTPASVFSAVIGLERLIDLLPAAPAMPPADIAILAEPRGDAIRLADEICLQMRGRGIAVWDVIRVSAVGHHLREFAQLGLPFSTIIGERELDGSALVVRDREGKHHAVHRDDLAYWLTANRDRRAQQPEPTTSRRDAEEAARPRTA